MSWVINYFIPIIFTLFRYMKNKLEKGTEGDWMVIEMPTVSVSIVIALTGSVFYFWHLFLEGHIWTKLTKGIGS